MHNDFNQVGGWPRPRNQQLDGIVEYEAHSGKPYNKKSFKPQTQQPEYQARQQHQSREEDRLISKIADDKHERLEQWGFVFLKFLRDGYVDAHDWPVMHKPGQPGEENKHDKIHGDEYVRSVKRAVPWDAAAGNFLARLLYRSLNLCLRLL